MNIKKRVEDWFSIYERKEIFESLEWIKKNSETQAEYEMKALEYLKHYRDQ